MKNYTQQMCKNNAAKIHHSIPCTIFTLTLAAIILCNANSFCRLEDMKICLIVFLLSTTNLFAQSSSGGGYYRQYHAAGVKSYSHFQIDSIDSPTIDTMFLKKVSFDENGLMTKEEFEFTPGYKVWFRYEYNLENYLVKIDSFGLIGYGYGSAGPDTLVAQICEKWESFDTTSRIIYKQTTYENGDYEFTQTYVYNEHGALIRTNGLLRQDGVSIESYTQYDYNERGLPLSYKNFWRSAEDAAKEFIFSSGQYWQYEYW